MGQMQRDKVNHPGVLIITRQIADADAIRDKINALAKATIAMSFHSETDKKFLKLTHTRVFPILIITHQAFGNALEAVADGDRVKSNWDQIRRKGCVPVSKSFTLKSDALEWGRYRVHRNTD